MLVLASWRKRQEGLASQDLTKAITPTLSFFEDNVARWTVQELGGTDNGLVPHLDKELP